MATPHPGRLSYPFVRWGAWRNHLEPVRADGDDPVPLGLVLDLDEAFRVLEALEDARLELRERHAGLGLQDELATVVRLPHRRFGLDEGGVR